MYERITLTTDLAPASHAAFLHALALARRYRCKLDLLHVRDPGSDAHWEEFPQVRATLQKWGVSNLPPVLVRGASLDGMTINKVDVPSNDAAASLGRFMQEHGTGLIIAASHGRSGLSRLLHGSVTERLMRTTLLPTLLFGPEARSFISEEDGSLAIGRVVLPLAENPPAGAAYDELVQLLDGAPAELLPLHVSQGTSGFGGGWFEGAAIRIASGPVADAITSHAGESEASLIVMATEGAHGLKDAMFGSTASRVLTKAPCPVLLVPAR